MMLISTAIQKELSMEGEQAPTVRQDAFISWEDFQKTYLSREDNFKYEWLAGTVEKTPRTIERTQFIILKHLQDYFYQLNFADKKMSLLL